MSSDFHAFTVLLDDKLGMGRGCILDGVELKGIRDVAVATHTHDLTTVTIQFLTDKPVGFELCETPDYEDAAAKLVGMAEDLK